MWDVRFRKEMFFICMKTSVCFDIIISSQPLCHFCSSSTIHCRFCLCHSWFETSFCCQRKLNTLINMP